jgi:hypothetical protein
VSDVAGEIIKRQIGRQGKDRKMAAIPPENNPPLDGMTGDELRAHALRHGFVLDDWSVNTSPFQKNAMEQELPWEDVEASRRNRRLQKRHRLKERLADGLTTHFGYAKPCPKCQTTPGALTWFYFESPKWTWENLCGSAGWMAVCDRCRIQVNYFSEVMS